MSPAAPVFLANGYAGPDAFPGAVLAECAAQVLRSRPEVALQYGPIQGVSEVREMVAGWLRADGMADVTAGDVFLTPGGKQGLSVVARALRPDVMLTSTPTYMTALGIFRSQGLPFESINTDADGLCTDELEQRLGSLAGRSAVLYTMSDFHNPTGTVMTAQRRTDLVRIAQQFDLPVLEDNPYRWLRFEGEPVPPLASYGGRDHVVSVGSFSKILAPGLRLAWMVVPPPLREVLVPFGLELAASPLTQLVVHSYFSKVSLADHLARTTTLYRNKRDTALAALAAEMPDDVTWTHPDGGYYTWVSVPGVDSDVLSSTAAEAGVIVYPGSAFLPAGGGSSHVRVNYAHETPERIVQGVAILARVISDLRSSARTRSAVHD